MAEGTKGGAALLERVLAGDEAAMASLIAAAWPRWGGVGSRIDRAELRQEALGELIEAAHSYRDAPAGDFASVAVARLKRRFAAVLRAERNRRVRLRPLDAADNERFPDRSEPGRADTSAVSPWLANALRQLPPHQRLVIAHTYWQELSSAEAAARNGVAPGAIRRARRQAEAELRRLLGGKRPGPGTWVARARRGGDEG